MPVWLIVALSNLVVVAAAMRGQVMLVNAAAVLVPGTLVIFRRPQIAILALIAVIPFDGLLTIIPHPFIAQAWKEALTVRHVHRHLPHPAPGRR